MKHWGESHYEALNLAKNCLRAQFVLTTSESLSLGTQHIDFSIACPKSKLKKYVCMEIPWGREVEDEDNSKAHCLKLLTNWHVLKNSRINWFDCLKSVLIDRGFK